MTNVTVSPFKGFTESVFVQVHDTDSYREMQDWCKENCDGDFAITQPNFHAEFKFIHVGKIPNPMGGHYKIEPSVIKSVHILMFDNPADKTKFLLTFTETKGEEIEPI